jgi:hypothetical protein
MPRHDRPTVEQMVAGIVANGDTILPDGTAKPISTREIAARIGTTQATVHNAWAKIRKRLGAQAV